MRETTWRAGPHADEWFSRTCRPWRSRVRRRFLIAAPAVALPLGLLAIAMPGWRQLHRGLAVGALAGMYASLLNSPPDWIERKGRGRDGERPYREGAAPA